MRCFLHCCFANAAGPACHQTDFTVNIVLQHLIPDLVVLCHGNDDFSLGVSFFKVSDRIRDLIQRITPIDNGSYLASFKK
jgi:hypothetical protein